MNRFLSQDASLQILDRIRQAKIPATYDPEKHRLLLLNEAGIERLVFRLPITIPPPEKDLTLPGKPVHYVILLVQSGSCAIGYFENGLNLDHKVIRAYMVRKKRGVSQIKHLKTKGKSRAGSRVRLAETEEFFDNINERLQTYFAAHEIDRVALSLPKILMPYFYKATIKTPFEKQDPRIFKIPKHIHTPIYEILLDTNKFLQKGELIWEEKEQELVDTLFRNSVN
ncbi:hypothetical protein I5M27_12065 [Adhaeribacter sp. BT258]|uniref:VLRF1 domain-containing protein n=1 Tax=Adhaeribacter terrigena TaxID=2793070 RepID=A0ABS1C2U5_9BACT|nr:hypothetical protein [Adhaeribacter terrigena]MBK0403726.1 hypothetical protein [Adhaeribacter terrigena]